MRTAEVVIVGAGIVGASIAWHLTRSGARGVLMLDREERQGQGSTGKSMGGVRAQFATEHNVRMSMYSIPFYARFEEHTGSPCGYKPHGYLFMATAQKHLDYLRTNRKLQAAHGLTNVEEWTREQIVERIPPLRADDILAGAYCPTDGFVDPWLAMEGFTNAAIRQGAGLLRSAEVTAIDTRSGRVTGVRTTAGDIATPVVVNAAGAAASRVAALAGASLPVKPLRRMLCPTEPFPAVPGNSPMVIDMSDGFHFRPEGRGLLLAWTDPQGASSDEPIVDPGFVERILTRAVSRVPSFIDLAVDPRKTWAGLYEMSPDHHCILGPAPEVAGLYYANGFSGHGVMHAPSTGKILADLVTTGRTDVVDAAALSVRRFAEGREIHESAIL
ncbi:MAG TPA: FAD-dependent oxidoreductase [Verrucomicrobiae bacterium]|nr:FAD-dependent oxidoreductase [Verrucomicrobiae bacterium]